MNRHQHLTNVITQINNNPDRKGPDIVLDNLDHFRRLCDSDVFSSEYSNEILKTRNENWNREFFQLPADQPSTQIILPVIDNQIEIPFDSNLFINEIYLSGLTEQIPNNALAIFEIAGQKSIVVPLSFYPIIDGKVSIGSSLCSYNHPFPRALIKYYQIIIRFLGLDMSDCHCQLDVSYNGISDTRWLDQMGERILVRKMFHVIDCVSVSRMSQQDEFDIIDYDRTFPHTGFIIRYKDGGNYLEEIQLAYEIQVGGWNAMGARFGGTRMKLMPHIEPSTIRKETDQGSEYVVSYTDRPDNLFDPEIRCALNMTNIVNLRIQLKHSPQNPKNVSYQVYQVICNIIVIRCGTVLINSNFY